MATPATLEPIWAQCPDCCARRLAEVVGHHTKRESDDENGFWFQEEFRILRCRGCEAVYFQTDSVFSEDVDYVANQHTGELEGQLSHKIEHWPAPSKRTEPDWSGTLSVIDDDLADLFRDIYVAMNNDLRVLSAIGIRTAFDRASELLEVDPATTFAEKLARLVDIGKIGMSERDTLNILTDAGNAAAHRGWKPTPKELNTMMSIFEGFLHRNFVLVEEANRLKTGVPAKPIRKKH